jgi:hypothetical protein
MVMAGLAKKEGFLWRRLSFFVEIIRFWFFFSALSPAEWLFPFSPFFYIFAPLYVSCILIFMGKMLLGFQTSPSTFLFFFLFFCKF